MTVSIFSFQSEQNCVGKASSQNSPYEAKNAQNKAAVDTTAAPVSKFIKVTGRLDWKIFPKAIVRFYYLNNFKF